jgi:hypothetical protein
MSTVKIPEYVMDVEVYEESGILFSDFTDGGSTVGTYTCKFQLPVGFWIDRCMLVNVTGFAGNVSATITVGDGSDVDRLNTGTPSIFASLGIVDLGVPSGTKGIATAFFPVLTVTTNSDFTAVNAGALTIRVWGYQVL